MAPYDSDSGDEAWGSNNNHKLDDDTTALRKGRQPLGVTRNYVPSWKPGHAIREFYQNWKDAIVETSQLQQKDLRPIVKGFQGSDTKRAYTVEARHPITDSLLGYIRFQNGALEFTNFGAQLSRSALNIGETTKRNNSDAAGTHGEGFKVASLVMVRKGYRVRYEASKFYWTMKLAGKDETMLYCFLTNIADSKIVKARNAYNASLRQRTPRTLTNNSWEDVTVKIGRVSNSGTKITEADFVKWTEVSLDLNRPTRMIETVEGDLILDERFRGKIYLKGLLLEDNSTTKPYRYGYNFVNGRVNRDRERLSDPANEARVLAQLWKDAIQQAEEQTLDAYVSMLLENKSADVEQAQNNISEDTATKVWEHLQTTVLDQSVFYHDIQTAGEDVEIIRRSLKKEPVGIIHSLWTLLRKFHLVRTPQEHRCHLLHSATVADIDKTAFAIGVQRAFCAFLSLENNIAQYKVIWKQGDKTDQDLLFIEGVFEINNKWLDFTKSHEASPCWVASQLSAEHKGSDYFSCHHISLDIFRLVLEELSRNQGSTEEKTHTLYLRACENIHHMPASIAAQPTSRAGEIEVTWTDLDNDVGYQFYGLVPECRVVLHREETCSGRRADLILRDFEEAHGAKGEDTCGCLYQVVPRKDFKAVFTGLEPKKEYFAMVSRAYEGAIYGSPSDGVNPSLQSLESTAGKPATSISPSKPSRMSDDSISPAKPSSPTAKSSQDDHGSVSDDENEPFTTPTSLFPAFLSPRRSATPASRIKLGLPVRSPASNVSQNNLLKENAQKYFTKQQELVLKAALDAEEAGKKQSGMDELHAEALQARAAIDDLNGTIVRLEEDKENLRGKLKTAEETVTEAMKSVKDTNILTAKVKETEDKFQKEVAQANAIIDDLDKKIVQLREEKRNLQTNIHAKEVESAKNNKDLTAKIKELEDKIMVLTSTLKTTEEDLQNQISIANRMAQRVRQGTTGIKRERETSPVIKAENTSSSATAGPAPKRAKTGVDVDLTNEEEDEEAMTEADIAPRSFGRRKGESRARNGGGLGNRSRP